MDKGDLAKMCSHCRLSKPAEEFAWRLKISGERDNLCRTCRSAYGKAHYASNRQRYIDQAAAVKRRRLEERTRWLLEYFADHPCRDCGESDPVVLEFDHQRDKSFSIAQHLARRSWRSILDEIEKCEVRCANCHRRRTAAQRGAIRLVLSSEDT